MGNKKRELKHNPINVSDTLFGLPLFPEPPLLHNGLNVSEQQLTDIIQRQLASFSVEDAREKLNQDEEVWISRGQERALALFRAAATYVPAYQDVLKKHSVNVERINTYEDFLNSVPIIDKESYVQTYSLDQRYWHGKLPNADMIIASSGTFGKKPTMWPRNQILEAQAYLDHELAMAEMFELKEKSTLVIICFAMGMHIAGTITMQSMIHLSKKGYPLSVITPGNVLENILDVVKELSPYYEQVMLIGYPPYMKEVVDQGYAQGLDWKKMRLRFIFAAEGFNETWRTYMAELTGTNPANDFLSIYGSADAAAMAQETPLSIKLRRKILAKKELREKLFGNQRLPALFQYYPEHKHIETINGELVITATAGVPLIRYNIHDQGGIVLHHQFDGIPELQEELEQVNGTAKGFSLPFVYVYGRSNQMVVCYGANIYMEQIRSVIEASSLRTQLSGKVIMFVTNDSNHSQRLCIEVECAMSILPTDSLADAVTQKIKTLLVDVNSEYRDALEKLGEKVIPIVTLFSYGTERFHSKQMKHKWTGEKMS